MLYAQIGVTDDELWHDEQEHLNQEIWDLVEISPPDLDLGFRGQRRCRWPLRRWGGGTAPEDGRGARGRPDPGLGDDGEGGTCRRGGEEDGASGE